MNSHGISFGGLALCSVSFNFAHGWKRKNKLQVMAGTQLAIFCCLSV